MDMEKKARIVPSYTILRQIGSVCEYFYRKGVYDSAYCGDYEKVDACANRDDNHTTFKFVEDYFGRELTFAQYFDFVSLASSSVKAAALRNVLVIVSSKSFKLAMCTICDAYYRKGLLDGKGADAMMAKKYYEVRSYGHLFRRMGGYGITVDNWVDNIRAEAIRIYYVHINAGLAPYMDTLVKYMRECVLMKAMEDY